MSKITQFSFSFVCLIISSAFLFQLEATAQTKPEELVICAAIVPCMENGEIDPRFDVEGTCGDRWRAQCTSKEDLLRQCRSEAINSQFEIRNLQKKINQLQRKVSKVRNKSK